MGWQGNTALAIFSKLYISLERCDLKQSEPPANLAACIYLFTGVLMVS